MKTMLLSAALATIGGMAGGTVQAGPSDKRLDVYWIDVEGGAATLLVTPAGESVLIDAGNPGERDAGRIHKVATEQAGLERIDYLVVTHFHRDHFGGVADLAKLIPIGTLYARAVESAPEPERGDVNIAAFSQAQVARRLTIEPGTRLPLKQAKGTALLSFQFLGGDERFVTPRGARSNLALCKAHEAKSPDLSDNKNSVVMLVTFGAFRFFDGGDLTWNTEAALVCPKDRVGAVDLFQVNHHGLNSSNNPVLVRTLRPTVAVVNNGPRKGGEPGTFATLKGTASIEAIYQLHRNVRVGPEQNTAPDFIANREESCEGHHLKISVEPKGTTFAAVVPSTGHQRTYKTRRK
jgi:competence protein ComEC